MIVGAHHVCFYGNTARGEGGGIYLEGGSFSINDSSFTEFTSNSASVGGGMFSFDAQVSVDAVEKLAYLGNRAMEFGGAISIYPEQAQVTISASFVNNTAGRCGGAGKWCDSWRHQCYRKLQHSFLHIW